MRFRLGSTFPERDGWDGIQRAWLSNQLNRENQDQPTDSASIAGSSDTELYDLESLMDGVNNNNHVDLPTIDELRSELALPVRITNSMASPSHDVDIPADYSPGSLILLSCYFSHTLPHNHQWCW